MRTSIISEVYRLHHVPVEPITLQTLLSRSVSSPLNSSHFEVGKDSILRSAQHLHKEIPIRLASRIVDLEKLPPQIASHESVSGLRKMLLESFNTMIKFPVPMDLKDENEFMKMQMDTRKKHSSMHGAIADALKSSKPRSENLKDILDKFYHSRIGIRLLVDQHIAMKKSKPGYSGVVAHNCSPFQIVKRVAQVIKDGGVYQNIPDINVTGRVDATFQYIPDHLTIIVTEALKFAISNSIQNIKDTEIPPVVVVVAGGDSGVSIKISDRGGGFHWEDMPKIWSYVQSSASIKASYDPVAEEADRRTTDKSTYDHSFGMPIAQLYARYFGGELTVMPMEGYGSDTFLHLNCLSK